MASSDLRRQTINDLTNAALSARRLARALKENPRYPGSPDEAEAADALLTAVDKMLEARDLLESAPVTG